MMDADYYREQAARARRLAGNVVHHPEIVRHLHDLAQDFEELAADIEAGAIEVRRPELLSQRQRDQINSPLRTKPE
jgi:hypothetical protein